MTGVLVHTRKELEFGGKRTLVPQDLLFNFDGEEWLKLPSYAPFLLQVLAGKGVVMKNASLKNSQLLQDLLAQRNQALQQKLSEKETPDVLGLEAEEGQPRVLEPSTIRLEKQSSFDFPVQLATIEPQDTDFRTSRQICGKGLLQSQMQSRHP